MCGNRAVKRDLAGDAGLGECVVSGEDICSGR